MSSSTSQQGVIEDFLERVSQVLVVLSNVGKANYATRLDAALPDDHALKPLYTGINEMIDSLAAEQARSAAYQHDLEEKLAMIDQQRAAIRELSTPIMEVWEGVLCLPVVGIMDSARSSEMTDALLQAIVEKKARRAIIDITGIEVMDTRTADHFIRMAKAVRLLGAECVLTGINPGIAQTIIHMGVDLAGVVTLRSLRDALQQYVTWSDVPQET
jgi:rsbT co-antagonist protein RsbR